MEERLLELGQSAFQEVVVIADSLFACDTNNILADLNEHAAIVPYTNQGSIQCFSYNTQYISLCSAINSGQNMS